tara:strand:+ start:872 stop:1072 length:201 start_codon:yes stop_codon:yes gene_type:complete
MVLTTQQQAYNFALYALRADPHLQGLEHEDLVESLECNIWLVFGTQTFSDIQVRKITASAISQAEE